SIAFADGFSVDPAQLGAQRAHAAPTATRVAPRAPRMPAVLAEKMGHPENAQLYTQMLAGFEQIADRAKLARNDVAVAAAFYVAGAYSAYRNAKVSSDGLTAATAQLRDLLAASPSFANAAMADKQDMYESWAIIGALMFNEANSRPGDANASATGKRYLD